MEDEISFIFICSIYMLWWWRRKVTEGWWVGTTGTFPLHAITECWAPRGEEMDTRFTFKSLVWHGRDWTDDKGATQLKRVSTVLYLISGGHSTDVSRGVLTVTEAKLGSRIYLSFEKHKLGYQSCRTFRGSEDPLKLPRGWEPLTYNIVWNIFWWIFAWIDCDTLRCRNMA